MNHSISRWLARAGAVVMLCTAAACGGGDDNPREPVPTQGNVVGTVLSDADGFPAVSGARVSSGSVTATTGADGAFRLNDLPAGGPAVVKVEAEGHADAFVSVPVAAGRDVRASVKLQRVGTSASFDPARANTVSVPGTQASVQLPANGLVDANGRAPSGQVTAQLTPIDPAADPRNMPGDYTTSTGERMESFGALQVTLRDAAGNRLNLRDGATATVRVPLATRSGTPPTEVPLFYFNELTGRWVQEGTAVLKGTGDQRYYEGTVQRLGTWNCDQPLQTIFVNGCVKDAKGAPVAGMDVLSDGIDYSGSSTAVTDAEGRFRIPIRRGGKALIQAWVDDVASSSSAVAGPSETDITLPECLAYTEALPPPVFTFVSPSPTVTAGDSVLLVATLTGAKPINLRWQRNGVDIPGATGSVLWIPSAALTDNGARFTVVATNRLGTATSTPIVLTVQALQAPSIVVQPLPRSVAPGSTAEFSVLAQGGSGLRYQWRRNGVDIAGETGVTYRTPAVTLADDGALYSAVVSNALGSVTSTEAKLTVSNSGDTPEQKAALMRMASLVFNFTDAGFSPLIFVGDDQRALPPQSVCSAGSASAKLGGQSLQAGQLVPTNGVLEGVFTSCVNDGDLYDGGARVEYNFVALEPVTVGAGTSTLSSMRVRYGTDAGSESVANGQIRFTLDGSVSGDTLTREFGVAPVSGATLASSGSGITATFTGGTANVQTVSRTGTAAALRVRNAYRDLAFEANGSRYVFNGSYELNLTQAGGATGEVIVTRDGQRLGRIFGTPTGLQIEVDGQVLPF